jgi:DNA polymerase-3 subunit delta'
MPWNLAGAESVTGTLAAMVCGGRLPHALLFTGPRGCGKNTLARDLAAAINCASPQADGAPCGLCLSCAKIAKNIHPDLKTTVPSGRSRQIKMEDIQTLRGEMAFRPYEGRTKVFIIRQADRLTGDSGNALLKTLEEPPPDSLLILTSASEAEIMPTILSRCLRLRIPPLPQAIILAALAEQRGLRGEPARLLAALSAGALGPALALDADKTQADWNIINGIMGAPTAPARLDKAWQWVKVLATAENEEDVPGALNLLRLWWRETARLTALGPQFLEGPPPTPAQTTWAARLTPASLQALTRAQNRLEDSLSRFVKLELAFENYWLKVLNQ